MNFKRYKKKKLRKWSSERFDYTMLDSLGIDDVFTELESKLVELCRLQKRIIALQNEMLEEHRIEELTYPMPL